MRINSISNQNTQNKPSFKSVGFYLAPLKNFGIPINMRPLILTISKNDADLVFKNYSGNGGYWAMGHSIIAEKLSNMVATLGKKTMDRESIQSVRLLLKQLKEDSNINASFLGTKRLQEVDSIIKEGIPFKVGDDLVFAKDPQAIEFLTK